MIYGSVTPYGRILLPLTVLAPRGQSVDVLAILDTGFSGEIALPYTVLRDLGVEVAGGQTAHLADGRTVWFDAYFVEIGWDGSMRHVTALEVGDVALIGTAMLKRYRLTADWVDGGAVRIEALG